MVGKCLNAPREKARVISRAKKGDTGNFRLRCAGWSIWPKRFRYCSHAKLVQSLNCDNDSLIPRQRGRAVVGHFQNHVDCLPGLGVFGHAECCCERRRVGESNVARISPCVVVLPPYRTHRVTVRVRNFSLQLYGAAWPSRDRQRPFDSHYRRVVRIAELRGH